jgi:serine/threonine-protein kinase
VLDFGISKSPMAGSNLTATQSVMGTPAYMSPEQMRSSRDVDQRTDIWALGVVLYELLQGMPPYGGDTFSSMVIKVVNDPLPRLTVALPGDLDAVVYRCLEKDPARRFQNVAELAQALAKYAQSDTQAAISVQRTRSIIGLEARRSSVESGAGGRAIPPSTLSGAAGARTSPPGSSRRWPILAGLVVLVAVVAVAVVASNGGGQKAAGPGPAAASPSAAAPAPPAAAPTAPPAATPPAPSAVANTPAPAPAAPAPAAQPPAAPAPAAQPPAAPAAPPSAPATATAQPAAQPPGAPAAQPAPTAPEATSPVAKKPKKPSKSGGSAKSEGSAKPPDDDVLGSRN